MRTRESDFEIARQLAAAGFHVFLGARNAEKGKQAVEIVGRGKGKATFLVIDVSDGGSVRDAAQAFARHTDCLDVLVNNAGIIVEGDRSILEATSDLILHTLGTNTLGPLRVTQAFLPFLSRSLAPRVINVSSGGGQLEDGLGTWSPAYCLSKTALNGVTSLLAASLPRIAVNSVCPGWVRTDMGGAGAPRSVQQGADTMVWLATEAPQALTGKFLRDREIIPW